MKRGHVALRFYHGMHARRKAERKRTDSFGADRFRVGFDLSVRKEGWNPLPSSSSLLGRASPFNCHCHSPSSPDRDARRLENHFASQGYPAMLRSDVQRNLWSGNHFEWSFYQMIIDNPHIFPLGVRRRNLMNVRHNFGNQKHVHV